MGLSASPHDVVGPARASPSGRGVRSLLFGDVRGFSRLTDEQLPRFAEHVLGTFAAVLDRYDERIEHQTAGATPSTPSSQRLLQRGSVRPRSAGCGPRRSISKASGCPHISPSASAVTSDPLRPPSIPITRRLGFMGAHVSRTARLEPVATARGGLRHGDSSLRRWNSMERETSPATTSATCLRRRTTAPSHVPAPPSMRAVRLTVGGRRRSRHGSSRPCPAARMASVFDELESLAGAAIF